MSSSIRWALFFGAAASLSACDRNGRDLVQRPDDNFDPVKELGEINVIEADTARAIGSLGCEAEDGSPNCFYDQVGTPPAGTRGGVTFSFKGTGEAVCIIMDPEAVSWNQSISPTEPNSAYIYPDNIRDDGDLDLFGGLSSYYTGSPGVDVGDFTGYYTDSLGNVIEIDYDEDCSQVGSRGQSDAHGGRGAPEYCEVDTELLEGVDFTVVLQTFATPLDDGILSFGAMVVGAGCGIGGISVSECTIPQEALDPVTGEPLPEFAGLEAAFCDSQMLEYCCANPDMCGDDPPEGACDGVILEEEEE